MNNLYFGFEDKTQIECLDTFRKSLEKDFFSDVTVRNYSTNGKTGNLVIEIESNFTLVETLFYLKNGIVTPPTGKNGKRQRIISFFKALSSLRKHNQLEIDIEEVSLLLKDITIVINKIYDFSIPEQLENVLNKIAEHHIHFTKGLSETPFELYLPVFEEDSFANVPAVNLINPTNSDSCKNEYFDFWGLYFDSKEDAVIYDLKNKSIIEGDLFMLNQ